MENLVKTVIVGVGLIFTTSFAPGADDLTAAVN